MTRYPYYFKTGIIHDVVKIWIHGRGYGMSRRRVAKMILRKLIMQWTGWGPL